MSRRKALGSAFTLLPAVAAPAARTAKVERPTDAGGKAAAAKDAKTAVARSLAELDPSLVDPSPFLDRFEDDSHETFASFVKSFEEQGQKVPIQVRPHPRRSGRYQVVYGHRRLAALKKLGAPVLAEIVDLTDRDLAIAQGLENSARQDLSWIERAHFAVRMDRAGFRPKDIYVALSIDDAELARMRGVWRNIPADIIEAIGRAPKIGRPRWVALATSFAKSSNAIPDTRELLQSERMRRMESDARFAAVHDLLAEMPTVASGAETLEETDGFALGQVRYSGKELRIVAANERGKAFAEFVRSKLPRLVEEFSAVDHLTPKKPVS